MLYHNIINTKTKRLSKDIVEQQMGYQIKREFYEKIQKSNVFKKIGIDSKTIEINQKSTWKAILSKRGKKECTEKYNYEAIEIHGGRLVFLISKESQ